MCPVEVDAVKNRGKGGKGKDSSKGKGKGKGKSDGRSKDKGETPKSKSETSEDDRTCHSSGRRDDNAKDYTTYGVTEVQTYPQRLVSAVDRLMHLRCQPKKQAYSALTLHSASSVRGVNDATCESQSNAESLVCRSSS